jgi:transcriptional regulator with XRE-family HTH domain/predicted negative regulator of RcsB-dependent stress response
MARQKTAHVDSPEAVGERIRAVRTQAGLSQRDLAFPGCSPAYLPRIEAGQRTPSLQLLREIGRRLGVTADYLAVGEATAPVDRATEGEVALALGEREEARGRFSELLESPDVTERARALSGMATLLLGDGAVDDACDLLEEAVLLLGENVAEFPRTVDAYVRAHAARGVYESGAALLIRIRASLTADDPRAIQYGVLLANCYIDEGDHARAAALLGDLRAATENARDPILFAKTLWSQSRLHVADNKPALAAHLAAEAVALIRTTEHHEYAARATHLLAYIELQRGNAEDALRYLDDGWPFVAAGSDRLAQAQFRLERARALAALGQIAEAQEIATGLLTELEHLSPVDATRCAGIVADVLAQAGDAKRALETYEMAVELLPHRESPMLVDLYTRWSDLLAAEGQTEQALAVARRALTAQQGKPVAS